MTATPSEPPLIPDSSVMVLCHDDDSDEGDFLLDLLTCHRPVLWLIRD